MLTKISKDFDQTTQYHSLFQLEEFAENLILNLNQHEPMEHLFEQARRILELLDQSNQNNLLRVLEQYQIRWKDLRERLNKKLEETSKLPFDFLIKIKSYFRNHSESNNEFYSRG